MNKSKDLNLIEIRMKMIEYLKGWKSAGNPKPVNDESFYKLFVEFLKNQTNKDNFSFSGDNNYCGSTAVFDEDGFGYRVGELVFEFAYGEDFIKIFTLKHDGFWVPEYINLKGAEAEELLSILYDKLIMWSGFKVKQSQPER